MRLKKILAVLPVLLVLQSALTACHNRAPETQTLAGYDVVPLHRVAVMPFLPGNTALDADDRVQPALDCTLMEFCQAVNELGYGAEGALTRQTQRVMERRLGTRVIPQERSAEIFEHLPPRSRLVDTPRQLAQRFGRAAGADHVILGSVWRYRERERHDDEGASVAFTIYLLEVDNGRRVWRGRFDKTQQALTDDLLNAGAFFKKGARWLSAEELARFGIEEVMQKFPRAAE